MSHWIGHPNLVMWHTSNGSSTKAEHSNACHGRNTAPYMLTSRIYKRWNASYQTCPLFSSSSQFLLCRVYTEIQTSKICGMSTNVTIPTKLPKDNANMIAYNLYMLKQFSFHEPDPFSDISWFSRWQLNLARLHKFDHVPIPTHLNETSASHDFYIHLRKPHLATFSMYWA